MTGDDDPVLDRTEAAGPTRVVILKPVHDPAPFKRALGAEPWGTPRLA